MTLSRQTSHECVALRTICDRDAVLTISYWAPVGSDWRPAWAYERQRPDELHIHVGSQT